MLVEHQASGEEHGDAEQEKHRASRRWSVDAAGREYHPAA
jgi:hypothetical protein